jgi:hypothetical protein
MRAVAKTAGKESVGEREREDARSVVVTIREAVAVVLGWGSLGEDIFE